MVFFGNEQVCKWLANHVSLLGKIAFRLGKHLSDTPDPKAYEIMEISRLCILPKDLTSFTSVCRMILATDRWCWLTECL